MIFHVISLPHTVTSKEYLPCAYTQKVFNFCKMMMSLGHTVYHYGGEGSTVECTEHVTIITADQRETWFGHNNWRKDQFDFEYNVHQPYWVEANKRAIVEIGKRIQPQDFICVIAGLCQKPIADAFSNHMTVEYGVGYYGVFAKYRVFESYAHMHCVYGKVGQWGQCYDEVIPNYFDPMDFPFSEEKEDYFLFVGRLIESKGPHTAALMCEQLGKRLLVAGQGAAEVKPGLIVTTTGLHIKGPVEYLGTVDVEQRGKLMSKARALVLPTQYIGPFEGVTVEAQMCFTADTEVFAQDIERAYYRIYSGVLLQLDANGATLQCTPEHPFLTQRGWVPAGSLTLKDKLVRRKGNGKTLDTERIGDLVQRLSNTRAVCSSENPWSVNPRCKGESESFGSTQIQLQTVFRGRGASAENGVPGTWSNRGSENAWQITGGCPTQGCKIGSSLRREAPTIHEGRFGDTEKRVHHVGSNSSHWTETRTSLGISDGKGSQTGFVPSNSESCKLLSRNDDPYRTSLLCRFDRWRGDCHAQENGQEECSSFGSGCQYGGEHHQLDGGTYPDSEYCTVHEARVGSRLCQRLSSEGNDFFHSGFQLPPIVQSPVALSDLEKTSNGNAGGVVRDSLESVHVREGYGAYDSIGTDGSLYEYTGLRAISSREIENVPVYNLGTRTGTYEANGLVVHNCGTPVITTDWGCYAETVLDGVTGFRTRTLGEMVRAGKEVEHLDPKTIRAWAQRYTLDVVKYRYEDYFQRLLTLRGKGWYDLGHDSWLKRTKGGFGCQEVSAPAILPESTSPPPPTDRPQFWKDAQKQEMTYWEGNLRGCTHTYGEERKALAYAKRMGLYDGNPGPNLYVQNRAVLDVGGGPTSLLLKCVDLKRGKVIDPLNYPDWVRRRYASMGIEFQQLPAEEMVESGWDLVLMYNVLQHVMDPEEIVKRMLKAGTEIHMFEWINIHAYPGHPHCLTAANLERWTGKKGTVEAFNGEEGCFAQAWFI